MQGVVIYMQPHVMIEQIVVDSQPIGRLQMQMFIPWEALFNSKGILIVANTHKHKTIVIIMRIKTSIMLT